MMKHEWTHGGKKKTKKLCPAAVLVRELYSALVSQFSQSKPYRYRPRHL